MDRIRSHFPLDDDEWRRATAGVTSPPGESVTVTNGSTTTANFTLQKAATSLEAVASTGTRGEERTVISAAVPIDGRRRRLGHSAHGPNRDALRPDSGHRAVVQLSAHVDWRRDPSDRLSTLRGLAPDQALAPINGKRRYTSALVNVNGSSGWGSKAVDLNAIPVCMIDHTRFLRDGAVGAVWVRRDCWSSKHRSQNDSARHVHG